MNHDWSILHARALAGARKVRGLTVPDQEDAAQTAIPRLLTGRPLDARAPRWRGWPAGAPVVEAAAMQFIVGFRTHRDAVAAGSPWGHCVNRPSQVCGVAGRSSDGVFSSPKSISSLRPDRTSVTPAERAFQA